MGVLYRKGELVGREFHPQRSHRGHTGALVLIEECVPVGQQAVSGPDRLSHDVSLSLLVEPGLAAPGVKMGVSAVEGLVGCSLGKKQVFFTIFLSGSIKFLNLNCTVLIVFINFPSNLKSCFFSLRRKYGPGCRHGL